MEKPITSLKELYAERRSLRADLYEQEEFVRKNFDNPMATVTSILSLLRWSSEKYGEPEKVVKQNILLKLSVLVLPLAVNTFALKKSGLLLKSLMVLLSVKAADKTNTQMLSTVGEKIKHLFGKKEPGFKAYRKPGSSGNLY